MNNIENKKILLIICGGISAYKSLEIIRLLKKQGATVKSILTKSAKEFITPLSSRTTAQTAKFQRIKRNTNKGIPIRMNDSRRGMISSTGNAIDKPISFIEHDKA